MQYFLELLLVPFVLLLALCHAVGVIGLWLVASGMKYIGMLFNDTEYHKPRRRSHESIQTAD